MNGGRLITIEGGEGAGKSTQATRLCAALEARGLTVVCTREPGGSPGAEEIRRLLVSGDPDRWDAATEVLLHFAARRDHLVHTVQPALARGGWVVAARFAESTLASPGHGLELGPEPVLRTYAIAMGSFAPHLTIILDLPVDEGLERARQRGGDNRYERMDRAFHQRLRDGFLEIARREPERCAVIDARPDPDAVHREIVAVVEKRLGLEANG